MNALTPSSISVLVLSIQTVSTSCIHMRKGVSYIKIFFHACKIFFTHALTETCTIVHNTHTHTYKQTNIYKHIHTNTQISVRTHKHIHTHTDTHKHI